MGLLRNVRWNKRLVRTGLEGGRQLPERVCRSSGPGGRRRALREEQRREAGLEGPVT